MKSYIGLILAVLTIAALSGCGGSGGGGTHTFTFAPPDDITFDVEFVSRRIVNSGDSTLTDSSWSHTPQQMSISDGKYEFRRVTDSMVQYRGGELMTDPILSLFASTEVTMVVDSTGRVYDVRGYEELFAGLDERLGADTAAMLRQVVNPLQLKEQEATSWNDRFLPFVGREFTVGVPDAETKPTNLPVEGPVDLYEITELADTVRVDGRLCGRLMISSSTNPSVLAELTGRTVDEVVTLFALTEENVSAAANRQAGSSSTREWVMELETMLTHSEVAEYSLFLNEPGPSGTVVTQTMEETQHKTYTYQSL